MLQRIPSAQVRQGWLDSRLNIATENMNKTNLIPTAPLPPSITYNSRISEQSPGQRNQKLPTAEELVSPQKLRMHVM